MTLRIVLWADWAVAKTILFIFGVTIGLLLNYRAALAQCKWELCYISFQVISEVSRKDLLIRAF